MAGFGRGRDEMGVSARRRPAPAAAAPLADEQLAIAWHAASLLLGRPGRDLFARLEPVHRASHQLPDEVGGPLRSTVVHLERAPLAQLEDEYAETFESCLRLAGFPVDDELSDLCAVLERAATDEPGRGGPLLLELREPLDDLYGSLQDAESGWAGAVAAVIATLPSVQ